MNLDAAPILVFWEMTRACGLTCRHCRAEAVRSPLPGQLSTEEGFALVRDIARFGPRVPVLILTGGDALMREDLFELVAYARSLGVRVGLAPSVTPLLTPDVMARMHALGVRSVSISLDGATAATHEAIRGVDGHFERTLEALRMLVAQGFRVQVNTLAMRGNATELADVAALLRDLGVSIWEVFFLVKVGRGTALEELTPRENEDVAHFLVDAARSGLVVRTVEAPFFRRVAAERAAASPDANPAAAFGLGPLYRDLAGRLRERLGEPRGAPHAQSIGTRDGKGIVFVAHDGAVYPAGFLPVSPGNVRERSILELYRDDPMFQALRAARFSGRCGMCEYRDPCGGSRARAYAASGDPLGEDPGCLHRPSTDSGPASRPAA